jgi:2-dehydro-3-deoxyphosphooctonate aldolase (KDO 8-P synthase)
MSLQLSSFFCIAGPCVIESFAICNEVAAFMTELTSRLGIPYIFKASFDKANRSSQHAFRGLGIDKGLQVLADIKEKYQIPVLTDIHETQHVEKVAEVVDVLQIPAFLCRQTDLIIAAAKTQRTVNIKKGQFLAPLDMRFAMEKFNHAGGQTLWITERGSCFGYHDLIVDMRSLYKMRTHFKVPIIFDATHSVQKPSAGHKGTLGERELAPVLARAATAAGIDGLFCEVHPNPDEALSDGPNSLNFAMMSKLLEDVVLLHKLMIERGYQGEQVAS